jgi:hypothetical protein
MVKSNNSKAFSFMDTIPWNRPKVKSKSLKENCHVFYPPGKSMIPHLFRCQGFAVAYYSFTLGRLRSAASSTFATSGTIYIDRCTRYSPLISKWVKPVRGLKNLPAMRKTPRLKDKEYYDGQTKCNEAKGGGWRTPQPWKGLC